MDITIEQAELISSAARKKAQEIGVPMNIAIVDAGANLKAFHRMDNAWLGSIDIAIRKAKTARLFDMESGDLGKLSQPEEPLYGIEVTNGGLVSFPGGIPLKNTAGEIVGAIGVSGGTVQQDREVALTGAGAFV
ncbi:GlcG/HbpS family heme-binding protein [Mucilaginibacter ginkgonis]|uniref:Heme-binding protein n=1 Tax=Mucilaginibacter ginkgonis TaxID=2682091 RepID=A0A6I4IP27_9SPHI|nr:heme-binding protein [Mucilaginibacter ginkgonis]QQL50802.1 heme-binding protein [Mucilaginibacter ginkgonis]